MRRVSVTRSSAAFFILIVCFGAGLAGCAERSEQQSSAADTTTLQATDTVATTITSPAGPAPADAQAPVVTAEESRYLTEALQQGMGHVALAQSVSARSVSTPVDQLAREIIAVNNETNEQLARFAAAHSVTLPADAAAQFARIEARFQGLSGRNLDAAYLAALLEQYPSLLDVHGRAATNAVNMELKKLAVSAQSRLSLNLRQARTAYAQVTGDVPSLTPKAGSPSPARTNTSGQ